MKDALTRHDGVQIIFGDMPVCFRGFTGRQIETGACLHLRRPANADVMASSSTGDSTGPMLPQMPNCSRCGVSSAAPLPAPSTIGPVRKQVVTELFGAKTSENNK